MKIDCPKHELRYLSEHSKLQVNNNFNMKKNYAQSVVEFTDTLVFKEL